MAADGIGKIVDFMIFDFSETQEYALLHLALITEGFHELVVRLAGAIAYCADMHEGSVPMTDGIINGNHEETYFYPHYLCTHTFEKRTSKPRFYKGFKGVPLPQVSKSGCTAPA